MTPSSIYVYIYTYIYIYADGQQLYVIYIYIHICIYIYMQTDSNYMTMESVLEKHASSSVAQLVALAQVQKRPTLVSKETYTSPTCRPCPGSKETYTSVKRDLH
jgi:hypothetical protein